MTPSVVPRPAHQPATRLPAIDAGGVVVAADGGWDTRRALASAAKEAAYRGVGLLVVTVTMPAPVESGDYEAWTRAEHAAADRAHAVNQNARRQVRDERPDLVVDGVVVEAASDLAEPLAHAGLLVLGRRGASGRGVFRMGTTSGELARLVQGPILVTRDEREGMTPRPSSLRKPEVVVGIHLAEEIPTVLRRAAQEAKLRQMPLCVFSSGRSATRIVSQERVAAEAAEHPRLVWTSQEHAAQAILRYADPDDLIVLGARGHERLAGHVPGSVSRAVLDAMPCDVLLVPL